MRELRGGRKRSLLFDLTKADIVELIKCSGGYCSVTGVRLRLDDAPTHKNRSHRPWAPTFERIDSAEGYPKDNCRVVCAVANHAINM